MTFKAYFFCPQATSVVLESDHGSYLLQDMGNGHWTVDIQADELASGCKYRYRVDGQGCFPDPINAHYVTMEGSYFSVFTPEVRRTNDFPEIPAALYHTSIMPHRDTIAILQPTQRFGPGNPLMVAVLVVHNLRREENSVVWVWQAPSGRLYFFDDVVLRDHHIIFSAVHYDSLPEFGTWATSCYLNGRLCGTTECTVRSIGYPPTLVRTFSTNPYGS